MVDNIKIIEGKKYMWDGKSYENEEHVQEIKAKYETEGFETQLVEANGQYLIYTRRVVAEVVLEGEAPP